jgi:hypothetical protein
MFSRLTRLTYIAAAASLLLSGPAALASDKGPSCASLENSLLPAPEWYADRCLNGAAVRDYSEYKEAQGLVPGDIAFYKGNFPAPLNVKTAPLATLNFTTVGPNAQPLFAMTFNTAATTLYAIDNTTRQLGIVNQTTGAFTSVGAMVNDPGTAFTVLGMAFDVTGGNPLEAYVALSNGTVANLYRMNVSNATLTLVAPIANFPLTIDIVVDRTGQMWGFEIVTDNLIRINKATGATTVVGPSGIQANFAQGMMYDHSDDTIYGCSFVTVPAQQGILVSFNKTTGAATQLAGPVPDEMECGLKRAGIVGPCTTPIFGGISSATNGGTPACTINLTWAAAQACPNTTVKYNVYRSTVQGTPPSAATLLQSCLTTLNYTDTTALSGIRYYYIVRAEDNTATGNGPCNSGVTDTNTTEMSAVPSAITGTSDDVENGGTDWNTSGGNGTNVFTIVTTQAHSPTHSWFTQDIPIVSLQPLRKISAVTFPASGGEISWWHRVDTESTFDGYVFEYSLDGGTTWSDILAAQGTVPADPNRFLANGYNSTLSTGFNNPLPGRRAWSGAILAFQQVRINATAFGGRTVSFRFLSGTDSSVSVTGLWIDDIAFQSFGACTTGAQLAPFGLAVDTAGNNVYQPNETVIVAPIWRNSASVASTALTGALTNHTGPAGPTYTIPDGVAAYAPIAANSNGSCGSNCYSVANVAATRPITHWDSTAVETLTPGGLTKTWTLHVGNSFTDVVASNPFFRFVETILHKNVTGGCGAGIYCPSATTTREQMAVFVLVAREPAGFNPPACVAGSEVFTDVPATSPFCKWVEELARRGVVSGCGGGAYCASGLASREAMAVFVLRTLDGTLNPPACGATPMFTDVPASSPFCRWIEELVRRGVVTGCGGGNYCPAAGVTREQMAVFLTVTFGLTLYGL